MPRVVPVQDTVPGSKRYTTGQLGDLLNNGSKVFHAAVIGSKFIKSCHSVREGGDDNMWGRWGDGNVADMLGLGGGVGKGRVGFGVTGRRG